MRQGGLENLIANEKAEPMKTAIILPDMHVPFHDQKVIDLVTKYISYKKPNVIVQLGDMYDCYSLSKYDKDPRRIASLQEEINEGKKIWKQLKKASPKSQLVMLEGNHCRRLHKYLMKNPELYGLDALQPEKLFGLDELGVSFYKAEKTYFLNKSLVVSHGATDDGCKLSIHSGYSAKNTMDKWGNISGIMGHSHRIGMSTKTLSDGSTIQWVESGCLSNLQPEYLKNPNWQHGISVVEYTQKRFHITPITIVSYEFMADGKLWK